MITYPISSNFCEKISLQCYQLYNFPSFRSSYWRSSVRTGVLRNFTKFTGKHLWQSLFFNEVVGWGDYFWSFLCLLLKNSCLFHFKFNKKKQKKWSWKGEIPWRSSNIYFFARISICLTSKISKEIRQMVIWSENVFKGNLMLQFSWLEEFRYGKVSGWWTLDELQYGKGFKDQL